MGTRLRLALGILLVVNLALWGLNVHYGKQLAASSVVSVESPEEAGRAVAPAASLRPTTTSKVDQSIRASCQRLGPFDAVVAASAYGNRLKNLGLEVALVEKAVAAPAGYWVLAPVENAAEGRALATRLDTIPMRDWQIVRRSPYGMALSMGLFNVRSAAEVRLKQVRPVAPDALIYAKQEAKTQFWIEAKGAQKIIAAESVAVNSTQSCSAN